MFDDLKFHNQEIIAYIESEKEKVKDVEAMRNMRSSQAYAKIQEFFGQIQLHFSETEARKEIAELELLAYHYLPKSVSATTKFE